MSRPNRRERIEQMKAELTRRGAQFYIAPGTPEVLVERFLQEVMECPECGGKKKSDGH